MSLVVPAAAVILGIGAAGVLQLVPGPRRGPAWGRTAAAALIAILLVGGLVPSPLSPTASWREASTGSTQDLSSMLATLHAGGEGFKGDGTCLSALRRDLDAGKDLGPFEVGEVGRERRDRPR